MKANSFYSAYIGAAFVVFEKLPKVTKYIITRDGKVISEGAPEDYERPYLFDRDHRTELFKPASRPRLYFEDNTVVKFQTYTYQVFAERENDDNDKSERIKFRLE